jgi:glycosyltransferase involved in cell wall biosynthesis
VRDAIHGFLIQKTTFPFEIIIHDDASTDNTADILNEYKNLYPDLIKTIIQRENQYSRGRHIFARFLFPIAKGRYLALCEGDDYWVCADKLQSQVDALERRHDASMSFHDVGCEVQDNIAEYIYPKPPGNILGFSDILQKHYIPTCSLLIRRASLPDPLPPWYFKCMMGDVPLELILADKGCTVYVGRKMGIYRKHAGGITASRQQNLSGRGAYIFIYSQLRAYLRWRYWHLLSFKLWRYRLGYIKDFLGLNAIGQR